MTAREWKLETTKLIIEVINKLPRKEREAFVCKHYKGMNVDEIADSLHQSVDETRETLKRAEKRLNQDWNRKKRSLFPLPSALAFC